MPLLLLLSVVDALSSAVDLCLNVNEKISFFLSPLSSAVGFFLKNEKRELGCSDIELTIIIPPKLTTSGRQH